MTIFRIKFPLKYFWKLRRTLKDHGLDEQFLYHKATRWGHVRLEAEEIPPLDAEFKIIKCQSKFTNVKIMDSLAKTICVTTKDENDNSKLEELFLYDLFDLYGFNSQSLIYGKAGKDVFFSHKKLPKLVFIDHIMKNVCEREQCQLVRLPL